MTFTDALSSPGGRGSLRQGETGSVDGSGQIINDAAGAPLAGFYPAFRGAFSPQDTGGFNSNPSNGQFGVNPAGQPVATSIISTRTASNTNPGNIDPAAPGGALGAATFDGNGFGVGNLVGEYAVMYRLMYIPGNSGVSRTITVSVRNIEARYLFESFGSGFFGHTSNNVLFSSTPLTFSFQVPAPCTGPLLALGAWTISRRRRA